MAAAIVAGFFVQQAESLPIEISAMLDLAQGATELMPISSTAHMRVVPELVGWRDPGSAFSAAMQLAALAAVLSYFWRDVSRLTTGPTTAIARRRLIIPNGAPRSGCARQALGARLLLEIIQMASESDSLDAAWRRSVRSPVGRLSTH